MSRRLANRAWLPLLACGLTLLAQVAGAHLHLCLDGIDAPMRAHASVADDHADHHHGGQHQDVDLAWVAGTPAKLPQAAPVAPPLLLAVVWVCVLWPMLRRIRPPISGPPLLLPSRLLQRPPSRGPPSFSR